MKKLLILIIVFGLAAVKILPGQTGNEYTGNTSIPDYPGAFEDNLKVFGGIMAGEIEGRILLTKDPAEDVKNFYARDLGQEPFTFTHLNRQVSFFPYDIWNPGHYHSTAAGVKITSGSGGAYKLEEVFNTLTSEVYMGNMTEEEAEKIKNKYAHLESASFPHIYESETESFICKSRHFYNKIFKSGQEKAHQSETEASYQDLEKQMQDAMAGGDIGKMQEIAMKLQQTSQQQTADIQSGKAIESCRKWLEEVDEAAYETRIKISNYFILEAEQLRR